MTSCRARWQNEVHRDDGRGGDGFFETGDNLGQGALELGLVEFDLDVFGAQEPGGFGGVAQFVVLEGIAVADGISRPGAALLVHEGQEQAGIESAAEKQADRAHRLVGVV